LQSRQHMSEAYRRPAVEAVTREFQHLAGIEIRPKQGRIPASFLFQTSNGLRVALAELSGLGNG